MRQWARKIQRIPSTGKRARYGFGDVLSLKVLTHIVDGYGVGIGQLADVSELIFDTCTQENFERLRHVMLVINTNPAEVEEVRATDAIEPKSLAGKLVVDVSQLLIELESAAPSARGLDSGPAGHATVSTTKTSGDSQDDRDTGAA